MIKVCGFGVNDSDYNVNQTLNGKLIRCPFYQKWRNMLTRCYNSSYKSNRQTYEGCSVCNEWLTFSNFKSWMETQDWEGKELDKDLLFKGNKIYSPETCVFLDKYVHSFISDKRKGLYPSGVSFHKKSGLYQSALKFKGLRKSLGYYENVNDAHNAWLKSKNEYANLIANSVDDINISEALRIRYLGDLYELV